MTKHGKYCLKELEQQNSSNNIKKFDDFVDEPIMPNLCTNRTLTCEKYAKFCNTNDTAFVPYVICCACYHLDSCMILMNKMYPI